LQIRWESARVIGGTWTTLSMAQYISYYTNNFLNKSDFFCKYYLRLHLCMPSPNFYSGHTKDVLGPGLELR